MESPLNRPVQSSSSDRSATASGPAATKPASPTGGAKHVELSPIHDFAGKLLQPEVLPQVKAYVQWQARMRGALESGTPVASLETLPDFAPISINLDITTACNYACDHCVDMDILNQPIKYSHDKLRDSLKLMAERGLRSVIVIGGGEPTVYRHFEDAILWMKELGLQVAIVSNGSGMKRIDTIADSLEEGDWIRLSLDSGSDETFQAMHKPRRPITLDEICEGVALVKRKERAFKLGFSYIVTWRGAEINDSHIVENLHEMVPAAERARRYKFDYISFKPFLTRAPENNAEIVDLKESHRDFDAIVARVRAQVEEARKFETADFRVYEATNLKVLENKSYRNYTQQPRQCHMQFFRQVLSPLGMYNCPVYRNQPHGRLGSKDAYATPEENRATSDRTAELIRSFDAHHQCREVTCLYNHVNWWLEGLIAEPTKLDELEARTLAEPDFFL